MKRAFFLIFVLALCLGLCACGENTPTTTDGGTTNNDTTGTSAPAATNSTQTQPLADFDILGEWVIADDGLAVITFNEDGTCAKEGEQAVKYKVEADIAVLTIYYSTPQSYNIEKVGEHYRMTGEHFLLRESDSIEIIRIKEKQETYERALNLLAPYLAYTGNPWQISTNLGYDDIGEAYELLKDIGDYKDAQEHLSYFLIVENVMLQDDRSHYGYDEKGLKIWEARQNFYTFYYYNENGYVIRSETFWSDPNVVGSSVVEYIYNEKGWLVERIHTERDGSQSSFVWVFDDVGYPNYIRSEYHSEGYISIECYENKYDELGRLIERKQTQGGDVGGEGNIWRYSYDDEGNVIIEEVYYSRGEGSVEHIKHLYSYESGNLVEETRIYYKSDGITESDRSVRVYEYQYDASGNLTQVITYYRDSYGNLSVEKNENYIYGTFYWYIAPEA